MGGTDAEEGEQFLNVLVSFGNIFLVLSWSSPENWVASTIESFFFFFFL